jgi:WD40 repeat protein
MNSLKYRNIYGETSAKVYEGVKFSQSTTESCALKGNAKHSAFPWQASGGGSLCVLRNDNVRKIDITIPKIIGHKGEVTDFDFSPFDDGSQIRR